MRAPNGFGTVARLSGNRRRPFIIKKTVGWNDKGHPIYDIIGYAATREEGLMILSEYNRDPWDVDRAKITLQQLFDLWKEKKAPKLGESNRASMISAYKYCKPLERKPYKNIKAWGILFALMGIGAARIYLAPASNARSRSLLLFLVQLVFNFFWSIIFFNLQAFGFAFLWLIALWVLILLIILSFRKVDKPAAWLQIPYLLWVTFAAYLNFGVWLLNR